MTSCLRNVLVRVCLAIIYIVVPTLTAFRHRLFKHRKYWQKDFTWKYQTMLHFLCRPSCYICSWSPLTSQFSLTYPHEIDNLLFWATLYICYDNHYRTAIITRLQAHCNANKNLLCDLFLWRKPHCSDRKWSRLYFSNEKPYEFGKMHWAPKAINTTSFRKQSARRRRRKVVEKK